VTGGVPLAAVDSINVGSPERPHVYGQFVEAVEGLWRRPRPWRCRS